MSTPAYHRIGELLVAEGHLTPSQLEEALVWRTRTKQRFGEVLTELGFVLEEHVIGALAKQFDHPVIDLQSTVPDPEAVKLVDAAFAIGHVCLPISIGPAGLKVAISDPLDIHTIDMLASMTRMRIDVALATPSAIKRSVNKAYAAKSARTRKPRPIKRQADRDSLLDLLSGIEPWKSWNEGTHLKEAA